ncbi:hypothetical protein [Aliikangiella sp. G2MR2-5]|uniref:hypothetical protein n=1 Tax=Aliikangiella sp. G2MR2-5 TaxID=2788943 RepID=UPI001AEE4806|nr:hypothetical protein [Aliikangiella sp. G2MR2-5]
MQKRLPELVELERLLNFGQLDSVSYRKLDILQYKEIAVPVYAIDIGRAVKGKPHLPWYRGKVGLFARENQLLEKGLERITQVSPFTIAIDCHSGLGLVDRIWFPYAYRRGPMKDVAQMVALKLLWESSYPNHRYIFEPQSNHYCTNSDLWDYFYKKYGRGRNRLLPLTLEMGSWSWVKKRPLQLFQFEGMFNPMVPHRLQRTLRRHLPLMDFLCHATQSYQNRYPDEREQSSLKQMAHSLWHQRD